MNHTPGPWWVEKGDGDCTPKTMIYVCHEGTSCDETTICNFDTTDRRGNHDANARLIAAAPDMLEALIDAYKIIRHHENPDYPGSAELRSIKSLIERATGRNIEEAI